MWDIFYTYRILNIYIIYNFILYSVTFWPNFPFLPEENNNMVTYVVFKSSQLLFQNISKQAVLTARHEVPCSLIKNP